MLGAHKIFRVICLVISLSVLQIDADDPCIPLAVENITISYDADITWQISSEETCTIARYTVYVDNDVGTERIYMVSRPLLNVNYLPVCDDYIFRIIATSDDHVDGPETTLFTKIPLPATANLSVGMLMVSQGDEHWVHLDWSMDDAWLKCADRFRVIVNDEDIDHLQDIYTFNTSVSIPNLAPCTSYEFGVIAIYNWAIEGPVTVVRHATPEGVLNAPRLRDVSIKGTGANLTWSVDDYAFNKCPVTKAEVTVGNSYNFTVDILDQTDRQPFNVSLTNLQPENTYIVNMTVFNSAGPSLPVVLAVLTPPN